MLRVIARSRPYTCLVLPSVRTSQRSPERDRFRSTRVSGYGAHAIHQSTQRDWNCLCWLTHGHFSRSMIHFSRDKDATGCMQNILAAQSHTQHASAVRDVRGDWSIGASRVIWPQHCCAALVHLSKQDGKGKRLRRSAESSWTSSFPTARE